MLWCFNRFLSYHKLNYKYIRPVFVLTDVFDKTNHGSKERSQSAGMEIVFYRDVAFRRNEAGAEKHEEIRRWSGSLFQKKVFELRLFAIRLHLVAPRHPTESPLGVLLYLRLFKLSRSLIL